MKKTSLMLPLLLLAGANAQAFETVARVTNVSPINETVNHPAQKCWTEYQQTTQVTQPPHDYGGAVAGGIIGGLIGSQFGGGKGKLAATAVGAGIGAVAGDHAANRNASADYTTATTPVQRCQTVDNFETRVAGYMVTYEFDNWKFTTKLPYHPGNQLRVNVAVTPK